MSTKIRDALGRVDLTLVERVLLGVLVSHDRKVFNPSEGLLATNLYGRDTKDTRNEVRQVLQRLENKGVIKREFQSTASGRQTYTHIWVDGDDGETTKVGSTPTKVGSTPTKVGSTHSPKSNKSKESNATAIEGDSRGKSIREENTFADLVRSQLFTEMGLDDMDHGVWEKLGNRLDRWYSPEEKAYGCIMFFNRREENIKQATSPCGYVIKSLPVWLGENVDEVRDWIDAHEPKAV